MQLIHKYPTRADADYLCLTELCVHIRLAFTIATSVRASCEPIMLLCLIRLSTLTD
jgi:hypothetical protein